MWSFSDSKPNVRTYMVQSRQTHPVCLFDRSCGILIPLQVSYRRCVRITRSGGKPMRANAKISNTLTQILTPYLRKATTTPILVQSPRKKYCWMALRTSVTDNAQDQPCKSNWRRNRCPKSTHTPYLSPTISRPILVRYGQK